MALPCICNKRLSQVEDEYTLFVREKHLQNREFQRETGSNNPLFAALKACSRSRNLERGKQLHAKAIECRHGRNIYVVNAVMNMYAKCGSMVDARQVFDSMQHPTVVSWTVLIMGYADNGQGHAALDLFFRMRTEGPAPNYVTLMAAVKACTSVAVKEGAIRWQECRNIGKELHSFAIKNDCSSTYMQSSLVDMYAKCGSMVDAQKVFDSMKPTVVTWNTLILGYADNGQTYAALELFNRLRSEGLAPDAVTLVAALKACTSLAAEKGASRVRDRGKAILSFAVQNGCSSHAYVKSTLIDLYSKCGSMADARDVFDGMKNPDVVSWTALISGYADNGQGYTALHIFNRMRTRGHVADHVTLVASLKACTSLAVKGGASWSNCKEWGKGIHSFAVENGCNAGAYVQSTLVDMYSKCGSMIDAHKVFDAMKLPDVVSWTALIMGYADNGKAHTALKLFARMRSDGPAPNLVTFGAAIKACGLVGALEFGRKIHSEIENEVDIVLVTCLVDFYAKCGSLLEAQRVFDLHSEARDMITWNALLAGFSSSGDYETVFRMFEEMQDAGFKPDGVTFVCILTSCSHAGLVMKGQEVFNAMFQIYGFSPTVEHYTCMIDILGRANKLVDAIYLVKHMHCSPNEVTWMTILGACRKWKNVEIGRIAFKALISLNDNDAAAYVLMGQIFRSRRMLQEMEMVMEIRKRKVARACKIPETCWTNEAGDVDRFLDANV